MELMCFVVFVCTDQHTQTTHRDSLLRTEELEFIPVLPALQRQRVPRHLHNRVLTQSWPQLVLQGVSLAQGGVAGQTGPNGLGWRLYAVVTENSRGCWRWRFGLCCRPPVADEVLYFGLKADVCLQSEVRGQENLALRAEERSLVGPVCFPHSLDTGEAEVMSAGQRHRVCEDVLADGALQSFLNSLHSCACSCSGSSECTILFLALQLINVSQASLGLHTSLMCPSVRLLKMSWYTPVAVSGHWLHTPHTAEWHISNKKD